MACLRMIDYTLYIRLEDEMKQGEWYITNIDSEGYITFEIDYPEALLQASIVYSPVSDTLINHKGSDIPVFHLMLLAKFCSLQLDDALTEDVINEFNSGKHIRLKIYGDYHENF